ncbi:MAG: hypothetical protein IJ408_07250 [Clostridia bacterium]|nr:hypothetical protein [Clostridia bacterium]
MKSRIILAFLIICLIFTLFSCSKAPETVVEENVLDNTQKDDDLFVARIPPSLGNSVFKCTDLFTATVIKSEVLPPKTPILSKKIFTCDAVLYTVEVKSAIRDFSVTENTKAYVVRFVKEADEQSEDYFLPFEIGKAYVICGEVQLLDGKPFILDDSNFTVELKDDGTLVPLSLTSSELFENVKTYDELLQDKDVKDMLENYDIDLPEQFYPLLETEPSLLNWDSSDTRPKDRFAVVISEKEEVQKLIKEAMPIDSKKTLDIKTTTYEELEDAYRSLHPEIYEY